MAFQNWLSHSGPDPKDDIQRPDADVVRGAMWGLGQWVGLRESVAGKLLIAAHEFNDADEYQELRYFYHGLARHMEAFAWDAGLDAKKASAFFVKEKRLTSTELMAHAKAFKEHEDRVQAWIREVLKKVGMDEVD